MSANHNRRRQAAVPNQATSSSQWGVQPDRAPSSSQWGVQPDRDPSSRQWGVQPDRAPSSRQPPSGVMGSRTNERGAYPHYEMPIPPVRSDFDPYPTYVMPLSPPSNTRAPAAATAPSPVENAMMQQLLEMQSSQEQLIQLLLDMKRHEKQQAKCIAAMQSTMDRMQSRLDAMDNRMAAISRTRPNLQTPWNSSWKH